MLQYSLLGLLVGLITGLIGSGGNTLLVLALMLLGFPTREIFGTSLFIQLLPLEILGVYEYYQSGNINLRLALFISIGMLLGIYFGSNLSVNKYIDEKLLKNIFAIVLLISGIRILFFS